MSQYRIIVADVLDGLRQLPDESVHCCVTSPPYWGLRDYGMEGQIGQEPTPDGFVAKMVDVFREVRRVLRSDGTLWLNLGDSYFSTTYTNRNNATGGLGGDDVRGGGTIVVKRESCGLKPKDLCAIPWRTALALRSDGWWLRQDIVWHKPNPMPEPHTDRCTKAHEYIFLLSKSDTYHCERIDQRLSVWNITTKPYPEAHFATFPPELPETCIKAGCPVGGTVLDPFCGSGTTIMVACQLGRSGIGIELNPQYADIAHNRIQSGLRPSTFRRMDVVGDAPLFSP